MLAKIHEIFTSIQGEGLFSGKRQLFIRFFGCGFNCAFCDTLQDEFNLKEYSVGGLLNAVQQKAPFENIQSVSITGGEPLLQSKFLKIFLPQLKKFRYEIYLETNGIMYKELKDVIEDIDIVAMDIKLPGSTGLRSFWDEHSYFLDVAMKKYVFVKAVVTQKTTVGDIYKAADLIAQKNTQIPFVLQPVTPKADVKAIQPVNLESFRNIISERLGNVGVIPQMHKMFGIK